MAKICMPELQRNILRSYDGSVGMFNSRGGGNSLTKGVSMDVRRVQNLGRAKFPQKNLMPGQKSAQKPNDRASFHEL